LAEPTIMSATVAGPLARLRPTPSYTTLRDVTDCGKCDRPDFGLRVPKPLSAGSAPYSSGR